MIQFIADLGEFHRLHAAYNTSTVIEVLRWMGVQQVYSTVFMTPEHPLKFALETAGVSCTMLAEDDAQSQQDQAQMFDILNQYAQGKQLIQRRQKLDAELVGFLRQPLTAQSVHSENTLNHMLEYHTEIGTFLEEGPATAYRKDRLSKLVGQLQDIKDGVVLAAVDDIPDLIAALEGSQVPDLSDFRPGESSRLRALADRAALIEEDDDLETLVTSLLREEGDLLTPKSELQYAAANIYLAVGDLESARSLLFDAAHGVKDDPRYLPGLIFARLGQVRDALGDRENAMRAYQAVLALSYAPEVAIETAKQGMQEAFNMDGLEPSEETK
ncbi:tetratricopeptide repeat protein [Deinococcus cellulosilyticus]|uniref:Tetratricopeptide repeat protein n=1 Tax=Deinococcus cellulosilyticus (strain DSM 18568 / NBRC 106333 / KACC 11606 / 5516J-15) TaxID=1223518 RepID=A0A511NA53_DEIC1|nr:hypothetical protein [Deinococcus cellulosilyticus]GEM49251.1 hypothetical protein DC3_48860 [Deinococcus cellulosilyticus NBRC 106333 = KACC 11606]